jgi:hypothetical protein
MGSAIVCYCAAAVCKRGKNALSVKASIYLSYSRLLAQFAKGFFDAFPLLLGTVVGSAENLPVGTLQDERCGAVRAVFFIIVRPNPSCRKLS